MISGKLCWVVPVIIAALFCMVLTGTYRINAQMTLKIGTFDSRAVAIAYYNSKDFKHTIESSMSDMKAAEENGDKKAIAKIKRGRSLQQAIKHEQGFGKGSINDIIEKIKDKIAALGKKENLTAIISKWEVVYNSAEVELVDITERVVDLFEPNERMKEMTKEVLMSEPVKVAYLIED